MVYVVVLCKNVAAFSVCLFFGAIYSFFLYLVKGDHQTTSSTHTGDVPHNAPCFVDDIFVALREAVGNDGELTNSTLANFGLCTVSDSSGSVLLELSRETNRNRPEVLHPVGGNGDL